MVVYPTVLEQRPWVAINAHRRRRLRRRIFSVPNQAGDVTHSRPEEVVGVADIPVPIQWVGDVVAGCRHGLLPWAPVMWWAPTAVVCGKRTGLGHGLSLIHI